LYNGNGFFARIPKDISMNAEGVNFVDPARIISQVEVTTGATVADFGCGSGYFSFAFAKAVGAEGKVFALDILPSALEAVASRAKTLSSVLLLNIGVAAPRGSGVDDPKTISAD
jgi:tRNA A58 N-methylase Trm61